MSKDEALIVDLAEGKNLKQIALEWNLTRQGIEWRWLRVKRIFGFKSYVDACRFAIKKRWIEL